jgi:DNA-binding NtrC family response regulator
MVRTGVEIAFEATAHKEDFMEAIVCEQSQGTAEAGAEQASGAAPPVCFVVDDDAGICRALSFTLRKLGFDTADFATPAALDAALAERKPVLLFLDLGLGQAGAIDVLPILAKHEYKGFVQLMSGRSQAVLDEVVTVGQQLGLQMLPALPKPFRMGVVKELVGSLGVLGPGPT